MVSRVSNSRVYVFGILEIEYYNNKNFKYLKFSKLIFKNFLNSNFGILKFSN